MVCGGAALSERPVGRVRRAALVGVWTGGIAVVVLLVLVVLAALGI